MLYAMFCHHTCKAAMDHERTMMKNAVGYQASVVMMDAGEVWEQVGLLERHSGAAPQSRRCFCTSCWWFCQLSRRPWSILELQIILFKQLPEYRALWPSDVCTESAG
jgi:hypothetical protein